jgi:hypothetical protein
MHYRGCLAESCIVDKALPQLARLSGQEIQREEAQVALGELQLGLHSAKPHQ